MVTTLRAHARAGRRVTFDDLVRIVPLAAAGNAAGWRFRCCSRATSSCARSTSSRSSTATSSPATRSRRATDPFAGIRVADADRRRGCELHAKSHLIHLREGFLETQGDARASSRLIAASAPAFRAARQHRPARTWTIAGRRGTDQERSRHDASGPSASPSALVRRSVVGASPDGHAAPTPRRSSRATSTRASASGGTSTDGALDRRLGARLRLPPRALAGAAAAAQPTPPVLTTPVNDFAGVIDAASEHELDRRIRRPATAPPATSLSSRPCPRSSPTQTIREYAVKMFENQRPRHRRARQGQRPAGRRRRRGPQSRDRSRLRPRGIRSPTASPGRRSAR